MTFSDDYGAINAGSLSYFYLEGGKLKCSYQAGISGGALIGLKVASVPLFDPNSSCLKVAATYSKYTTEPTLEERQNVYIYLVNTSNSVSYQVSRSSSQFTITCGGRSYVEAVDSISIEFYLWRSGTAGRWFYRLVEGSNDTGAIDTVATYASLPTLGTGTYILGIAGMGSGTVNKGIGCESMVVSQG